MLALLLIAAVLTVPSIAPSPREHTLLDDGWKFALGNAADPDKDFGFGRDGSFLKAGQGTGALAPGFDDAGWRDVDLPHDWAVELPFVHDDAGLHVQHGSKPIGRMFPDTCVGWYRKHFTVAKEDEGRRVSVQFDGVFRDSQVWLNGHYIGRHLSGYTGFEFDVTDYLNYGGDNTLVVRADASQYEGWFYEGAGIYRHVWLNKKPRLCLNEHNILIRTNVIQGIARIEVTAQVNGVEGKAVPGDLDVRVVDEAGRQVARDLANFTPPGEDGSAFAHTENVLDSVQLWSIESPHLYTVNVRLWSNAEYSDTIERTVGFRTVEFDKARGVILNGKPIKIKGACDHQDHAGVGAAIPDRLNAWRIEQLKKYGFNALRTSHNAPTPELLDACDRLGFLVLDENRLLGSSEAILDEVTNLVVRDRNHPSVIAWSIANEEGEATTERGGRIAKTMMDTIRALDPTRPITYASNAGNNAGGANSIVDLRGFNYKNISDIDKYHKDHPDQFLWGTEEASALSTRGEYANDKVKGYMSSYDVNQPGWGATAEDWWTMFDARDWMAGAFVWTGFDYRGEPTPYGWPCISSHFGVLDTCGFPKDTAYYYKAWWTNEPVLHILPHWNWPGKEGQPIDVWVHSNHEEVELFLNGKSLGKKPMKKDGHLEWKVPYAPGELVGKGYRGGKVVQTETVATTGPAVKLELIPDRTEINGDGRDVSILTVQAVDAKGRIVPVADNMVEFSLEGPGRIIGVGNGDPSCHEPDTYFSMPMSVGLTSWKTSPTTTANDPAWHEANFDDSKWRSTNALGEARGIPPKTVAVYRTVVDLTAEDIKTGKLDIGQIDDTGWVYINGKLVHLTDSWETSWSIPLKSKAKAGKNVVVIVVRNGDGPGGLGRGVRISKPGTEPVWKRSLFHGLAQVIVQSRKQPGKVTMKASGAGLQGGSTVLTIK